MSADLDIIAEVDGVIAPHGVRSWAKVRSIIRSARRGNSVPGWVETESADGQYEALSGSHRMAAVWLSRLLDEPIDIDPSHSAIYRVCSGRS